MQTVPSMEYADPQQGGALGGYSNYPGVDPSLLQLMGAAKPGPVSPYAKRLDDMAQAITGDPTEYAGALSSANKNYDKAVMAKKAAIQRAMDRLSGLSSGQVNLPLLAAGAAGLRPAPDPAASIGNSFSAAAEQIQKQRETERAIASALGNLDIEGADTDISGANAQQTHLEQRLRLADTAENQAGAVQARSDLAHARTQAGVLQYAGRIGAAQIQGNKGRYKFIGNDPNNPTIGQYLDQVDGTTKAGPAATGGGHGGAQSVYEQKRTAWLALNPRDFAGALDYAAGHRGMTEEQKRFSALSLAQKELGANSDEDTLNNRAAEIYGTLGGGDFQQPKPKEKPGFWSNMFGGGDEDDAAPAPAPAAKAPLAAPARPAAPAPQAGHQPAAPRMSPAEVQQSLANARAAIKKNPLAHDTIVQRLKAAGIDPTGL